MINYAWISKLLRDVAFTWRARELSCWLKEWIILGNLAIWTVHILLKEFLSPREIHIRFCSKLSDKCFCWFPPPCWCPSGWAPAWCLHTNLYKFEEDVSPHIFHQKNCCNLKLGESLCIFTFFFSQILKGVTLKTSNTLCPNTLLPL